MEAKKLVTSLKKDIDKIREALDERPKTWGELIEETGIKTTRFKKRLDFMIYDLKEVVTRPMPRNRRKTLYHLRDKDETKAERRRFQDGVFIEGLQHPVASHKERQDVSWSLYLEPLAPLEPKDRLKVKKQMDKLLKVYSEGFTAQIKSFARESNTKKLAVIVTIEA